MKLAFISFTNKRKLEKYYESERRVFIKPLKLSVSHSRRLSSIDFRELITLIRMQTVLCLSSLSSKISNFWTRSTMPDVSEVREINSPLRISKNGKFMILRLENKLLQKQNYCFLNKNNFSNFFGPEGYFVLKLLCNWIILYINNFVHKYFRTWIISNIDNVVHK